MMLGGQGGEVALGVGIEEVNMSKLQLVGSQRINKKKLFNVQNNQGQPYEPCLLHPCTCAYNTQR